MSIKNNKLIISLLSLGLVLLVTGISYAFFMYGKTGLYTHTINGGKMKVIYDETTGNNITIDNAYPLTDKEALTKALEFEFTITGYNESDKNVYYAIEIDHGEDVDNKMRFKDTDIKLTMLENDKVLFENEIYQNLDNQDIYYGYFKSGTSSQSPMINNYKMRIWINDNVIISDTIENTISSWDEMDWRLIEDKLEYDDLIRINNNEVTTLSELGISVYTSEEFMKRYANFKINVRADLTYDDVGYLTYDANGGTNTPEKSSLLTNKITSVTPYNVTTLNGNKVYNAFLGWSTDPNAIEPEYYKGEYYSGEGKLLYAVYSDKINVMSDLKKFGSYNGKITAIYFINDEIENIQSRYDAATIKYDLTIQGKVLGWLETDPNDATYYHMYVGCEGINYLSTGYRLIIDCANKSLTQIDFGNANTSMVTDMFYMFADAEKLTDLDLSNFDTSNVTNMGRMFERCRGLKNMDFSSFVTHNVTNMSYMFRSCTNLKTVNLSNFDTRNVTNMSFMFSWCPSLSTIDINHFNVENVTNMDCMFKMDIYGNLTEIDLSNWVTSSLTTMYEMFEECDELKSIRLDNFDTSNVKSLARLFYNCRSLNNLNLSNFDTSNVNEMYGIFTNCTNLEYLDISTWNTENLTKVYIDGSGADEYGLFYNCESLLELDLSNWKVDKINDAQTMFYGCESLTTLDLSGWNLTSAASITSMFSGCSSLTNLNLDNWSLPLVTSTAFMFSGCSSLETIDLSELDTSQVTDMSYMFDGCSSLNTLDVSSFDTSNVTDMRRMFQGCSSLTTLDISGFDFDTITYYQYAFYGMNPNAIIYVGDTDDQTIILGISTEYRPSSWSTNNVIVKNT